MSFDVAVIGGGPAGLTAGIYAARSNLKTVILEKGAPGGQAALTDVIENYPGFPGGISGSELMQLFARQAAELGAEVQTAAVSSLETAAGGHLIHTSEGEVEARAVIIASGAQARRLDVPGEKEFTGRGVSYCAICDAAFFRGKKIAVVGGGDSAVSEALILTKFGREVHLLHRRDQLRAAAVLRDRAFANDKIVPRWNTVVERIEGSGLVETLVLKDVKTGELTEEQFDGVFVFVGTVPNTDFLGQQVRKNENGYIITDEWLAASVPGIFAAGDVREKFLRQVSTAVGDGALAAMSAEAFLG